MCEYRLRLHDVKIKKAVDNYEIMYIDDTDYILYVSYKKIKIIFTIFKKLSNFD